MPRLVEVGLALRALFFVGTRHTCPCCGWRVRAFTHGGTSWRIRHLGYCPRCNSKARHRRDWLFLEQKTNLFSDKLSLLCVSPNYCLSRRFKSIPNLRYFGVSDRCRPNICLKMNLAATPIRSATFDAAVCIHVLEHIDNDRRAMGELFRVLKPGGWALITVPIRLEQRTFEDPRITMPEERERAFGERVHVRLYGYDLTDRLREAGFQVHLDLGTGIDEQTREKYGLRNDENVFYCTKPDILNFQ
jgi:SAM-dependent methyltransferase